VLQYSNIPIFDLAVQAPRDSSSVAVALREAESPLEEREDHNVVAFNGGCNSQGAPVEITPERLHLGPVSTTDMYCVPETLMAQDDWLRDFFVSDPAWELTGDRLTLSNERTTIELDMEEMPP
jgi:heat shock protein HslJ